MKRLTKTILAAGSAAALAVGMAAPAMAEDNLRIYVENDHSYTFTTNMLAQGGPGVYPLVGTGTLAAPPEGDKCPQRGNFNGFDGDRSPFGVTVNAGEHKYVCYAPYLSSLTKSSLVTAIDGYASTDSGIYPLYGSALLEWALNSGGVVETTGNPEQWFSTSVRDPEVEGYDFTMTLLWEAPAQQEAQLANLMEVTPDDCTITGTSGDDVIKGTDGNDVICGLGGDDVIEGGDGDDIIKGGAGDDTIHGGDGDDTLGGGAGNDRVDGGSGDDAMHGATGEDTLVGGSGDDLTDGGSGDDILAPDFAISEEGARQVRSGMGIQSSNFIRHAMHTNTLASTDGTGNVIEDGNGDGVSAGASVGVISNQAYWDCENASGFDFPDSCFPQDDQQ